MTCIYCTVITADNDISMFHPSQSLVGFLPYNIIIFDKIHTMLMCMCYLHSTKMNGNLDCSYLYTQEFQWNFTCMQNGRAVHYFEYVDLRLDGMENNPITYKNKRINSYMIKYIPYPYRIKVVKRATALGEH